MKVFDVLRRMIRNSDELVGRLGETNARLREVIAGLDNQSRLINDKQVQLLERTAQLVAGVANQSRLLGQKSEELIEGVANQSSMLNDKLKELLNDTADQTRLVGSRLEEVVLGLNNQSGLLNDKLLAIVHRQDLQIELQKLEITAIRQLLAERGIAGDLAGMQASPVPAHGGIASDLASIQAPPVSASPIPSTAHSDTPEEIGVRERDGIVAADDRRQDLQYFSPELRGEPGPQFPRQDIQSRPAEQKSCLRKSRANGEGR